MGREPLPVAQEPQVCLQKARTPAAPALEYPHQLISLAEHVRPAQSLQLWPFSSVNMPMSAQKPPHEVPPAATTAAVPLASAGPLATGTVAFAA